MTRVEFIKKYYDFVNELSQSTGIFPEIVFAQAFIESTGKNGFGTNYNARVGNNFFAIKASTGWKGATITNPEVKSESNIFRAYDSIKDSIKDYFSFLKKNSRYTKAGVFKAADWKAQAKALAAAGYAGKGHEEKYFTLIVNVGKTVQKVFTDILKKGVSVVKENKVESGLILLAAGAAALYFLYGRK